MLYNLSSSIRKAPSDIAGLRPGSYEAFCLDQAVWFLGITVTQELDKIGSNKSKAASKDEAARLRRLNSLLGTVESQPNRGFADPAALFGHKK